MGVSSDTQIAISNASTKEIGELNVGAPFLVAKDLSLKSWIETPISFLTMLNTFERREGIQIEFENPKDHVQKQLLVSNEQPFLLQDKTLKPAQELIPGVDNLVAQDGSPCAILSVQMGMIDLAIWEIASSMGPTKNPDNHLFIANGIVLGDYALQIGM